MLYNRESCSKHVKTQKKQKRFWGLQFCVLTNKDGPIRVSLWWAETSIATHCSSGIANGILANKIYWKRLIHPGGGWCQDRASSQWQTASILKEKKQQGSNAKASTNQNRTWGDMIRDCPGWWIREPVGFLVLSLLSVNQPGESGILWLNIAV